MQKKQTIKKKTQKRFRKYINGTKGAISIFLALIMLPFLSMGLILVESARYQNAIGLVDELLDMVGLSSLAEFDPYLENRFGLLSISQKEDVSANYTKYLDANVSALGKSFTKTSVNATGLYPLSDDDLFKEQILDYSEVMGAVEALYKGIDIDEFLKNLHKNTDTEKLSQLAESTKGLSDMAKSAADLVDACMKAAEQHKTYNDKWNKYKSAAQTFRTDAKELIDALEDAKDDLDADADINDIYDDSTVKTKITKLQTSKTDFINSITTFSSSIIELKAALEKVSETAKKISTHESEYNKAYKEYAGDTGADKATKDVHGWVQTVVDGVTKLFDAHVKLTFGIDMVNEANELNQQKTKLNKVVFGDPSKNTYSSDKYHIGVTTLPHNVNSDFATVEIKTITSNLGDLFKQLISNYDNNQASIPDEQHSFLSSLIDVAGQLLDVSVFWDGALDAKVSASAFHSYNPSDMSFTSSTIMSSLSTIVKSGDNFISSLKSLNIIKALIAVGEFIWGIAQFLFSIVTWVGETLINLGKLIISGPEIYGTTLLASYGVYNLPCRTTYESGKSLTGFTYRKIFDMQGGKSGKTLNGTLDDLKSVTWGVVPGSDSGFRGAETEYLLIGGPDELLNQSATFFNLYMLRLLLNLPKIFSDTGVKTMAAGAAVAGWVVYLVLIIAEPMLDCLVLVNGESSFLIKEQIYLTPTGLPILLKTIPKLTGLPSYAKSKIEKAIVPKGAEIKLEGTLKMDYQEHLLALLLLTTDQEAMINRLQNIVQMETAKKHEGEFAFDLNNANTTIKANVSGRLNPMFDIKPLTESGPFSIERIRHFSY